VTAIELEDVRVSTSSMPMLAPSGFAHCLTPRFATNNMMIDKGPDAVKPVEATRSRRAQAGRTRSRCAAALLDLGGPPHGLEHAGSWESSTGGPRSTPPDDRAAAGVHEGRRVGRNSSANINLRSKLHRAPETSSGYTPPDSAALTGAATRWWKQLVRGVPR